MRLSLGWKRISSSRLASDPGWSCPALGSRLSFEEGVFMATAGASVQDRNKAVVMQMLEAFNKRDPSVVPKLLAPTARSASTFPGNPQMTKMPVQKRLREEILRTAGGGATGPIAFPGRTVRGEGTDG